MVEHIMHENTIDMQKINLASVVKKMQMKVRSLFAKLKKITGGRAYQKTYDKWKSTNYVLKVPHKTGSPTKRKLEEQLQCEQLACKKARKKVDETRKKLVQSEKTNAELQRNIDRLVRNKQRRGRNKNKASYSKSHTRRQFRQNIQDLKETMSL